MRRRRRAAPRRAVVALLGTALVVAGGVYLARFREPRETIRNTVFRADGSTVPEIAAHYNFPELDGRGQTIAFIEPFGGYLASDLERYFKSLGLSEPDITEVPVGENPSQNISGGQNTPNRNPQGDLQVTSDIEVAGSVAPKARIVLYFTSPQNYRAAVNLAVRVEANHVLVLSLPYSPAEAETDPTDLRQINDSLQDAAKREITVITFSGDDGSTNGILDGRAHVAFPASSPWVLAVGGTRLTSFNGLVGPEEVVWNGGQNGGTTGGGVSSIFTILGWQSSAGVPSRADGGSGRGIPDVAADADPETGYRTYIGGKPVVLGGTQLAAALWAGLIALVDQGVGHSIGYINPVLYSQIGPSKAFRSVTKGDNSIGQVKGCTAGSGWNACAGWGTPNGEILLRAFKALR